MAHYLVRAKANKDLAALRARLDDGEIVMMRPFGQALDFSLRNARLEDDGWATWEENDYCTPPLAMERAAVLDHYFTDLRVESVTKGAGWARIEHLPSLWSS
jgi:hypothetical protein